MIENYYNVVTGEYPRHAGDIQLIQPDWEPGKELPENWVGVFVPDMPITNSNEIVELDKIEEIDGQYTHIWKVRQLTETEITERDKRLKEFEKIKEKFEPHIEN